ncbi:MAG TPA: helix-turn-helix transcriptional regulator [Thermoanaerobaculia bacterium]|nr:helix-turn-helix transcriptional regulator [Thermoanaerobaculia bacterium]
MTEPLNVGKVFGERLRELRLKRKLTQADVAARSGLLQHHISQLENGVGMPTLATMLKLAAAIGCKPTDLLTVFNGTDLSALLEK